MAIISTAHSLTRRRTIEKQIPVGSKIVFEKWIDNEGHEFVAVNHVYQSLDQMLGNQTLNLDNPPMIKPLDLKVMKANKDGLYSMEDFCKFVENL